MRQVEARDHYQLNMGPGFTAHNIEPTVDGDQLHVLMDERDVTRRLTINLQDRIPWEIPPERNIFPAAESEYDPNDNSITVFCTPDGQETSLALVYGVALAGYEEDPTMQADVERYHQQTSEWLAGLGVAGVAANSLLRRANASRLLRLGVAGGFALSAGGLYLRRNDAGNPPDEKAAQAFVDDPATIGRHSRLVTYANTAKRD